TDQRGALRGALGLNAGPNPDIGAYEASSSYLVTLTTDTTDVGTLRAAVGWANVSTNVNPANSPVAPNTVTFDPSLAGQTINLTTIGDSTDGDSALAITAPVQIAGDAAPGLTIARSSAPGTPDFRIFYISAAGNLTLQNLTVSGGQATYHGGGIYNDGGAVTLTNDTLANNSAGV